MIGASFPPFSCCSLAISTSLKLVSNFLAAFSFSLKLDLRTDELLVLKNQLIFFIMLKVNFN